MPGIRFAEVRARVTMAEVLGLVGFVPRETSGDQVRGPWPHLATSTRIIGRLPDGCRSDHPLSTSYPDAP
jgi:hypothetical protein